MNAQLSMFDAEEKACQHAREYVQAAHHWVIADSERFKELQRCVLYLHRQGVPIQQGRIHAELVRKGYHIRENDMFSNDRNLWPTLARYLRGYHPCLKKSVGIRKSCVDDLELPPLPPAYLVDGAISLRCCMTVKDWR